MQTHLLRLLLALALLGSALSAQAARLALVIGNDDYKQVKKLRNAGADAQTMAAAFSKAGYEVVLKRDLELKALKDEMRAFRRRIKGGDEVVIFFSGHGVQLGGDNFLLPTDVRAESEDQVRDDALSLSAVLGELRGSKPAFMLAIVDACRDNPFPKAGKAIGGRGLTRVDGATGQMVLYAAGEGQQALDRLSEADPVRNGVFTRVFVKEMERPGLPIDQVLRNVRVEVNRLAQSVRHEQVPALYDQVLGTFYFYPPGVQVASLKPEPLVPGVDLGDLQRQAEAQAASERQQASALARMQSDFDKVAAFTGTPTLQAQAWERLLAVWSEDKAPGEAGRSLRGQAQQRLVQAREAARQPVQTAQTAGASSGSGKACPECPETVLVQPGSFQMGSPAGETGREADEGPVHQVRIGYKLAVGKTHVSKGEFAAFVNATGYRTEAEQGDGCSIWTGSKWERTSGRSWRNPGFEQGSDHPVVCVSWNDVQRYIGWLNEKSPVKGWRLLSEAEYEYAARAGTSARYWWGEDSGNTQQCQYANGAEASTKRGVPGSSGWTVASCDDGHAYTAPVGRFKANAWGLHDMAGNAWSWTQDCYARSYDGASTAGSAVNPSSCSQRVLRGGSWIYFPQRLRSAKRVSNSPDSRDSDTGFRIARTI